MVSLGGGYNHSETKASIVNAVAAGFRGVDTALTYFDQTGVRDGLRSIFAGGYVRSDVFVTTKVPGCVGELLCASTTKEDD